jgi:hypothetical protein
LPSLAERAQLGPYKPPEPDGPQKVWELDVHGDLQEIDVFGTGRSGICWEPTCTKQRCSDHQDNAIFLHTIMRRIDMEKEILEELLRSSREQTADKLLLPALDASCSSLKTADMDLDEGRSRIEAGARALVFYRRHTHLLEPYFTKAEYDHYENVCSYVPDILRNAGYSVSGD